MRVTLDRKLINLWPSIFMVINDGGNVNDIIDDDDNGRDDDKG